MEVPPLALLASGAKRGQAEGWDPRLTGLVTSLRCAVDGTRSATLGSPSGAFGTYEMTLTIRERPGTQP